MGINRSRVESFEELDVYRLAFESAMEIFEITKAFPKDERYSLTDQIRRSSRSVCANIAEAWHRRIYPRSWTNKLTDSIGEAAETITWISFAISCSYVPEERVRGLQQNYGHITGMLISMMLSADKWKV